MNVIDLLHKHAFTEYRQDILFRLPERVLVVSVPLLMPKFIQGTLVLLFFQVVDDSSCSKAFQNSKQFGITARSTGEQMNMVHHDHVCEEQERLTSFIDGTTDNFLHLGGSENWQSIMSYQSYVESRAVLRDKVTVSHEVFLLSEVIEASQISGVGGGR
jgi:hypothetical protein